MVVTILWFLFAMNNLDPKVGFIFDVIMKSLLFVATVVLLVPLALNIRTELIENSPSQTIIQLTQK